ncbi:MAG: hypothetical protein ACRCXD_07440 [Luteolibacter sp.]
MPNQDYIPTDDEGKAALFERFRDTIPTYATALGINAGEVADQAEDATWFRYILSHAIAMRDSGSQWISYKNALLTGTGGAFVPVTPPLPIPTPNSVQLGILTRFRALVRRIKAAPGYSEAMGEALGIIGPDSVDPDPATLTPEISLRTSGGQVEVLWDKGRQEGVEIHKDSGNGQWTFLALDTRPNYIDTTPFPTPAAMWKYRAIYCNDAQKTGQWSNVAEISVGG